MERKGILTPTLASWSSVHLDIAVIKAQLLQETLELTKLIPLA